MGPGYWLNPDSGKCVQINTTHDAWIRDKANADSIGLTPWAYDDIKQQPPTAIDEIRKYAMIGGLVRIRTYDNRISVQFMAQRYRTKGILWAILVALRELKVHPDEFITIGNVLLGDEAILTLADLKRKLEADETVLREHKEEVEDVPMPRKGRKLSDLAD